MARQVYNDTWASGGDKVDPGAVKTTQGWIVEAPPHEYFNFWQGRTDEMLQHLERNGIATYDSTTVYELGAYTREGTVVYRSLVSSNTGNMPSSSPSEWVQAFLIPGNNLSDIPDASAARTNLDVYGTSEVYNKTESDANYLPIGGKAADAELLDGIDSTTFARKDQANTFTADQVIKAVASETSLDIDADTGNDTVVNLKENGVRRASILYDESSDFLSLIKYDTDGTSVVAQMDIKNTGDINVATGLLKVANNTVYHPGNDGSGSGLDADLFDGLDSDKFVQQDSTTGAAQLPTGTSAQRPGSPSEGMFRRNSETGSFEGYDGTSWSGVGGASGGAGNPFVYQHDKTVTADHTIPGTQNAISGGPLTINTGVTVTVDTGATWTIVGG